MDDLFGVDSDDETNQKTTQKQELYEDPKVVKILINKKPNKLLKFPFCLVCIE
jgi:hypothetical protein